MFLGNLDKSSLYFLGFFFFFCFAILPIYMEHYIQKVKKLSNTKSKYLRNTYVYMYLMISNEL